MESTGRVFAQIYVIWGFCMTVYFLLRGFTLLRKEVQRNGLSSQTVIVYLAAIVAALMFWSSVISYVFKEGR